ncbi:MAG: glycoside hydrolase family 113 [Planctomycetota bacterium]
MMHSTLGAGRAAPRQMHRLARQRDKLVILAAFILVVGGVIAFQLTGSREPSDGAGDRRPVIPSQPREFLGMSLQLYHPEHTHPYEKIIREIAARTGANTLALVVHGHQEDAESTSIMIDLRKNPSDRHLREIIRYARSDDSANGKGSLKVVLMPIVLLENPKRNEWRGEIAPSDWDAWWEDYTALVLHYAKIAQQTDAEVLMIGSELISTERSQGKRWRELVGKVREVYDGRLGYSANWDHYQAVGWWDALDLIGMTTYHDLTKGKDPTVERMVEAWKPIKKEILAWRRDNYPHHPILFTEVGWPNQQTCGQYPWDYYRAPDEPDPQAQANCFEAFFEAWKDTPGVAGYLIWEWRTAPWQQTDPSEDTGYVPMNKPAEKVIRDHFRAAREKLAADGDDAATRPARP